MRLIRPVERFQVFRQVLEWGGHHPRQRDHPAGAQNNLGIHDIIGNIAVFYGMRPAGVGAVHAAECGVFTAGGIRREKQSGSLEGDFQFSQSIPGLAFEIFTLNIDAAQTVHVSGEIVENTLNTGENRRTANRTVPARDLPWSAPGTGPWI